MFSHVQHNSQILIIKDKLYLSVTFVYCWRLSPKLLCLYHQKTERRIRLVTKSLTEISHPSYSVYFIPPPIFVYMHLPMTLDYPGYGDKEMSIENKQLLVKDF